MERCVVRHEVARAEKENMSSLAGECLKCADSAIFSLHLGGYRIILKGGFDAQIVANGTTMGPTHSLSLLGEGVPTAYDFQVDTCKQYAH
jgi:hypothetical protein